MPADLNFVGQFSVKVTVLSALISRKRESQENFMSQVTNRIRANSVLCTTVINE